jgi:hypothetical protein
MGAQVVGNAAMGGLDAIVRGEDPSFAAAAGGGVAGALHLPATFAGVMAKTANHEMLALARKLKAEGASRDAIWQQTGWDVHAPGNKPYFEISDEKARFVPPTKEPPNRIRLAQQRFAEQTGVDPIKFATPTWSKETSEALKWADDNKHLAAKAATEPLGNVLVHPDLYAAYPDLANYPSMLERGQSPGLEGSFNTKTKEVTYGGNEMHLGGVSDKRSTLLHEAGGHAVQDIEGFPQGGTPSEFALHPAQREGILKSMNDMSQAMDLQNEVIARGISLDTLVNEIREAGNPGNISSDAMYLARVGNAQHMQDSIEFSMEKLRRADDEGMRGYRSLTGEVTSRNVQKRADMTAEERRATPPWKTQDVPDEQQIVRFRGLGDRLQSSVPDYRGTHTAPGRKDTAPLHDLTQIYPDDIYSSQAAQFYGHAGKGDPIDEETARLLRKFRGKPDAEVTVYRAVPKDAPETLNPGDWVTINRNYARGHGEGPLQGDYKIVSQKVRAGDLFTDANSMHEFGYAPEEAQAAQKGKK